MVLTTKEASFIIVLGIGISVLPISSTVSPYKIYLCNTSLKQFATRMRQANYSVFINWMTVRLSRFLETKWHFIIHGQSYIKLLPD